MIDFFRRYKKFVFLFSDVVVILLAAWFAFLVRFDAKIPAEQIANFYSLMSLSLIFSLPIFYWQRLYRFTWRFIGLSDLYQIVKAVTFANVLIAATLFILRDFKIFSGFPRSIIFINYFITLLGIGGLRVSKRLFTENIKKSLTSGHKVLIVGAGETGEELARLILKNKNYSLVGFVDDSAHKKHTFIHNFPVLGNKNDIPKLKKKYNFEEVILAFPSAEKKAIQETVELCRNAGIKNIKIIPSKIDMLAGKINLENIRDVSIEDLLGRERIEINTEEIGKLVSQRVILVTGGAGSIGSQLCRQILKFNPKTLIALDKNETGIFHLERDLNRAFPAINKHFVVGDICDENKMDWIFKRHQPQIVFHAAAYKHVPVMEMHPEEAVKNNIFGTLIVGQIAIKYGVKKFVAISTDKAINPTSIMGVSKRVCELICQYLDKKGETRFCAVRFGNVLDSQGNVVVLFTEQIKKGGPVEVTHPEMKRYFMVTAEACLLVMQAGAIGKGGEVFVLDMGEPIKIIDLAKEMIRLSGYQPDIDIPIVFTGVRPGEKLFEEIMSSNEISTQYQKIFIAQLQGIDEIKLLNYLQDLKQLLIEIDQEKIRIILKQIVPEYQQTI